MSKPIAIASDHAGYALKAELIKLLHSKELAVLDLGTDKADQSVDYPDFGAKLATAIKDGQAEKGVIICGTGIGISIAANRHPWIRAALCHDATIARLSRQHNDANVLALGARIITPEVAKECLETFLSTAFEGGRHVGRVEKLSQKPSC
jgi:ribose 5-phosphate isomerase B